MHERKKRKKTLDLIKWLFFASIKYETKLLFSCFLRKSVYIQTYIQRNHTVHKIIKLELKKFMRNTATKKPEQGQNIFNPFFNYLLFIFLYTYMESSVLMIIIMIVIFMQCMSNPSFVRFFLRNTIWMEMENIWVAKK